MSSLTADDRAGEDDPRTRQRGDRRVGLAGQQGAREQVGVGDVGGVEHVVGEAPQPLGQLGRARQHEVGARREALLGRAEAGGVDARVRGDVIDAVVDDERGCERLEQDLRLRHVGPQDRPAEAEPAGGPARPGRAAVAG